jgi:hypothetical protein
MTALQLTDYRDLPGYAIEVALSDCCCPSAVAWTLARLARAKRANRTD